MGEFDRIFRNISTTWVTDNNFFLFEVYEFLLFKIAYFAIERLMLCNQIILRDFLGSENILDLNFKLSRSDINDIFHKFLLFKLCHLKVLDRSHKVNSREDFSYNVLNIDQTFSHLIVLLLQLRFYEGFPIVHHLKLIIHWATSIS